MSSRILIVDDREDNRYLLESLLGNSGYETASASNGEEALELIGRGNVDLVISDILMPVMDGFQLCRTIRTGDTNPGVPFIFYTATYTGPKDEEFAMRIGADRFMVKPCDPEDFLKAVEEVLMEKSPRKALESMEELPKEEVFRLYSERLVRKLEQKMLEAERELKAREAAEAERERLRTQLAIAQRLESVGRLANSIAHDFNNYLTVILGRAEVLLDDLADGDPHRVHVEEIADASRRSMDLTGQLLAFSRKQKLKLEKLSLNSLLKNMTPMLKRLVGDHVEVIMDLFDPLPEISGDQVRLEQVVMNLAVNARDAMPEGGRLVLETSLAVLDQRFLTPFPGIEPGEFVLLSAADTGHGIQPDVLPRIFDPFFSTKDGDRGSGLGLSTVYGVVKQSGGVITVDSTPGEGTTFSVYLPVS